MICPTCDGSNLSPLEEVVDLRGEGPEATRWAETHTCLSCSATVYHVIDQDGGDDWVTVSIGGDTRSEA